MISKAIKNKHIGAEPGFQWRGDEITRIEGLSDAVFAFAVTLLVVSLEAPKSYEELYKVLQALPAFAMCFFMLMLIWYNQYKFFRRYGLQDFKTVMLTLSLLFVILFYVYPMKFLFSSIFAGLGSLIFPFLPAEKAAAFGNITDLTRLMTLYHIGVMAVWGVFVLLYRHAYKQRETLRLNKVEILDTKDAIQEATFLGGLGVFGLLLIIIFGTSDFLGSSAASYSGMMYGPLCGLYFGLTKSRYEKKRKHLLAELEKQS